MPLTAWLPGARDDEFLCHLRRSLDESVRLIVDEDVPAELEIQALVRGVPSEGQLDACPQLERLIIPYAGLPRQTRTLLGARPQVAVHNLHHNAASTAELALALLLAAAKRIVPFDRALRAGDWSPRYAEPIAATLEGSHALILGLGAIGRRVARACLALGMQVTGLRRTVGPVKSVDGVRLGAASDLQDSLPQADAVILCLPLTDETRSILGARELALLPAHACLVNVGRGELVEEEALFEALRDGRLGGAGLDVWYRYPKDEASRTSTPPSTYPFHELENVVLSPHRAGLTRQNEAARAAHVARLLHAASRGEDVPNRVDLERGY